MDEDDDDEMPGMPQPYAPADGASETDDDAMNESGTEARDSSHCHGINGIGRAT
jgi:hypothetical protein